MVVTCLRLRVVHLHLPAALVDRERLGRRMIRALPGRTPASRFGRMRAATQTRRLLVHREAVRVGLAVPDRFVAPVRRRRAPAACRAALGVFGSRTCSLTCVARVRLRIDDRHVVGALFERAVDRAVGVDRRIALVGRDLVVQVRLRIGPVPHRDDDVALAALRARRRRRPAARPPAMRSVQSAYIASARGAADLREAGAHAAAGLSGLDAAIPGGRRVLERAEALRDLARRLVAHLMAAGAAVGVDDVANPLALALDVRRDAVALSARCRGSRSSAAPAAATSQYCAG